MIQPRIPDALRAAVRERAAGRCEYCRMPEAGAFFAHEPDHIIATQHGGQTDLRNLASDPDREEARQNLWRAGRRYPG